MGAQSLVHQRKSSYQIEVVAQLVLSLPAAAPPVTALLPWQHCLTDHIHLFPPSHPFSLVFFLGLPPVLNHRPYPPDPQTSGLVWERNIFSLPPLPKASTLSSVSFQLSQCLFNWLLTAVQYQIQIWQQKAPPRNTLRHHLRWPQETTRDSFSFLSKFLAALGSEEDFWNRSVISAAPGILPAQSFLGMQDVAKGWHPYLSSQKAYTAKFKLCQYLS